MSGYGNDRCRCDACRNANTVDVRKRRARKIAARKANARQAEAERSLRLSQGKATRFVEIRYPATWATLPTDSTVAWLMVNRPDVWELLVRDSDEEVEQGDSE